MGLRAVDNMKDVVKRVMDNVMHHMAARVQAPGEERHRHVSVPDVVVATEFVCIVPEMARERLIQMTHVWMPALASFLPQVVVLVAQGKVDVGGGLAVGNALVESLKWAWIGIDSFRTVIFEACVSAIMEARACTSEDQDAIRASVRIVLLYLARCGRKHVTLQIVGQIITTATDYPSLREAKDYFEQIETVISTEPSNGISKKFAGELLSKFFPELCKSSELTSP